MQKIEHEQHYYDARAYWEERAKKYGSSSRGWKAIALAAGEDYYFKHVHTIDKRATLDFIHIHEGMKVLDVGCGIGRWSMEFARRGAEVTGVDISEEMVRLAGDNMRREGLKGSFSVNSIDEMDFPDNSFDLLHCSSVLMHVTDPDKFKKCCSNMVRVVRPGGHILLKELAPGKEWKTEPGGHMVGRTYKEYCDTFTSEGTFLVKEAGAHLWARVDRVYDSIAIRIVSMLRRRVHSIDDSTETQEYMEEKFPLSSKLFHLIRRILLTSFKPVEYYLVPLRPIGNLSDYKLMLFEKR